MCLVNMDDKVQNGSMGTVVGFQGTNQVPAEELIAEQDLPYGVNRVAALQQFPQINVAGAWPRVRFTVGTDGRSCDEILTVMPRVMTIDDNKNNFICGRMQIPLCLNYALTIHKGQGLTLKQVNAYLQRVFCHGQLYSALSRVRRFQDLVIVGNIGSETKCASPVVRAWFDAQPWIRVANGPELLL